MKILILTITAGQGHNQTANAIANYAVSHGHNALILDALEYISPIIKDSVNHALLLATSISPKAYGKLYTMAEKKEIKEPDNQQFKAYNLFTKKISKYINNYKPDAIICTHVFTAKFISDIKIDKISTLTIGVVTDFTLHPFWNETKLDYYVIPSDFLINQSIEKGIPEDKILPFGIPVDSKFNSKIEKSLARELVGIDNKPTVLVMSGSTGFGNIYKQLLNLCNSPEDFQIISICGNNKTLKNKIDKSVFSKKIYNIGYTDKVDIYMDACDIIVTKPGGITVSEAMAKNLPMILITPVPGHEYRNKDFLLNMGVAISATNITPLNEVVTQLISCERKIEIMKENIKLIRKPDAAETLVSFIENKLHG